MSKRIVIIPNFGESHLIKCQIPNLVETINPDIVIYNEGLFPNGPESKTLITEDFRSKYCYKDTNLAWDTLETQDIIKNAQQTYPNIKWIHNEMKFKDGMTASEAYTYSVSNWEELGINVEYGDYIFPYEPDIFHLESDKDALNSAILFLQPDEGFKTVWLDFLETQYYVEKCNNPYEGGQIKGRKIAVRYGTDSFYKHVMMQCESMDYSMLRTANILTYHYNWFRFDKNKELRYDQIVRRSEYWKEFENGLQLIKYNSINNIQNEIVLRPSRNDITRFASYINIEHPNAIKDHYNFIK
jgi:hypothetical protein